MTAILFGPFAGLGQLKLKAKRVYKHTSTANLREQVKALPAGYAFTIKQAMQFDGMDKTKYNNIRDELQRCVEVGFITKTPRRDGKYIGENIYRRTGEPIHSYISGLA